MLKNYDLIVIGTGSAGGAPAFECKKAGWRVAVIDSRPFGGTCAQRGCDPKKVLVGAAEIIDKSIGLKNVIKSSPKIDWSKLMKFKHSFTQPYSKISENRYKKDGIDAYHGKAKFIKKDTIEVGKYNLTAGKIVIATGSIPIELNIPGQNHLTYSDDFLDLKILPKDITFLGAGYISIELAHIAARSGCKVRIIHRSNRPLKNFDQDLVKLLLQEFKDNNIEVILNAPVKGITKKGKSLIVSANKDYTTDMVVHGAGRVAEVQDLDLTMADVKSDKNGIVVSSRLQTTNPSIYSGGDCVNIGLALTPVAGMHGRVIANNLLKGNHRVNHTATASVVFSYPPLASVGLNVIEAEGIQFETKYGETSNWYNCKRLGIKNAGYKILIDKNDRIIGAHILYPNSDEIINIFAMAIKFGIKASELKENLWAYPSSAYDIKYMLS